MLSLKIDLNTIFEKKYTKLTQDHLDLWLKTILSRQIHQNNLSSFSDFLAREQYWFMLTPDNGFVLRSKYGTFFYHLGRNVSSL